MSFVIFRRPYRFFLIAGVLALILCLLPMDAQEAVESTPPTDRQLAELTMESPAPNTAQEEAPGVPAGADLSERTAAGCYLHETLFYAPCGHSVQRREALPARLVGLNRAAIESEIGEVIPGAAVTGFSGGEVDISRQIDVPCPLHWVLRGGEDGLLHVYQNRTGEELSLVRDTDVPLHRAGESEQQELLHGKIFDDVQALEGYLESMSS